MNEENTLIKIERKILTFNSTTLQLSNISSFEIKRKPKKKYPMAILIFFILGILLVLQENQNEYDWYDNEPAETPIYAFICLGISILAFVIILIMNITRGKYLIITMNSGSNYMFWSWDKNFLRRATDEIANRIDNEGSSVINFKNCYINSSQIGTENSQFVGGNK